jgi:hypothetical protein
MMLPAGSEDVAQESQLLLLFRWVDKLVTITGDGVNDAPALNHQSAVIISIEDVNFASIVSCIGECRIIFDNIKTTIAYHGPSHITRGFVCLLLNFCSSNFLHRQYPWHSSTKSQVKHHGPLPHYFFIPTSFPELSYPPARCCWHTGTFMYSYREHGIRFSDLVVLNFLRKL